MVYQKYLADVKYAAVQASNEGKTLAKVNAKLGASISPDSFSRWQRLYEKTQSFICDPETYLTRGRPLELMPEEIQFIKVLVTEHPTVYLNKIQTRLREAHGIQVCVQTVSNTLHNQLEMSQKTVCTVHPNRDDKERANYIYQINEIPTECLVFVGEAFSDSH